MTTEELKSRPTPELQDFLDIAREHSRRSESTVRKDFECDDGMLAVSSHMGGQVEYEVYQPEPAPED